MREYLKVLVFVILDERCGKPTVSGWISAFWFPSILKIVPLLIFTHCAQRSQADFSSASSTYLLQGTRRGVPGSKYLLLDRGAARVAWPKPLGVLCPPGGRAAPLASRILPNCISTLGDKITDGAREEQEVQGFGINVILLQQDFLMYFMSSGFAGFDFVCVVKTVSGINNFCPLIGCLQNTWVC